MKSSAIDNFMRTFPRQRPTLCHDATLSLLRFVRTGSRFVAKDGVPFARALTDNLARASQRQPSAEKMIPPHLYSVFAVKDPEFSVIGHSALVISVEPEVVLAEGGLVRDGVGQILFRDFIAREARNGHILYEFETELLEEIYSWL
jgi:hypothetical protein